MFSRKQWRRWWDHRRAARDRRVNEIVTRYETEFESRITKLENLTTKAERLQAETKRSKAEFERARADVERLRGQLLDCLPPINDLIDAFDVLVAASPADAEWAWPILREVQDSLKALRRARSRIGQGIPGPATEPSAATAPGDHLGEKG